LDKPPLKNIPWTNCIKLAESHNFTAEQTLKLFPFLRPTPLKAPDVSLILKHKIAWKMIAEGSHEYAIVAEDDVVVGEKSLDYLSVIIEHAAS
jgi:hypothetical protein